jgi:hypothetical protein
MSDKREIVFRQDRKQIIIWGFFAIVLASLPSSVKCDMGDTLSSLILFLLFTVFICAGIGWWSRRGESK